MKLVIGGAFQGKTQTACRLFQCRPKDLADGESCAFDEIFSCRGIRHFHTYILRKLEAGEDVSRLAEEIRLQNPQIIILSDEIGYGIVPVNAREREWREQTGRICTELARYADTVVRVIAGIPELIKGKRL